MHKLIENIDKELKQIEEQGLNTNNLDMLFKLVDIQKDLYKIQEAKGEMSGMRDEYGRGRYMDYRRYDGYDRYDKYDRNRQYGNRPYDYDKVMYEHMDKVHDGINRYLEGKDRYKHGDTDERLCDGLERLMFGVVMLVESALDFAETPQEKEIIRQHIRKIKEM